MKCLRRLEDTDFPCDKSSNPDKEEKISVEDFSKPEDPWKVSGAMRVRAWLREGKIRDPNKLSYRNYKERVIAMQNKVAGLRDKLQRTSQEAKEKLQQEKPVGSGSGTSHK